MVTVNLSISIILFKCIISLAYGFNSLLNLKGRTLLRKFHLCSADTSIIDRKKNLVLGGTGFVGSSVISSLREKGNQGFVGSSMISSFFTAGNNTVDISKELTSVKNRLEKLEKNMLVGQPLAKPKSSVEKFVDSLTADTINMDSKTIEICSILGFFVVGIIIGASLLDRLWLLGGIISAYWASGAVYRDTRGGSLARKVGAEIAQIIRDLHEKYNQAVIFYQTGKLAMASSKIWEKYDMQFKLTQRAEAAKKLTMLRAAEFNTFIKFNAVDNFSSKMSEVWRGILTVPTNAKKLDNKYQITTKIYDIGKETYGIIKNGFRDILNVQDDGPASQTKSFYAKKKTTGGMGRPNNFIQKLSLLFKEKNSKKFRIARVNPWDSPFKHLPYFKSKDEYQRPKRYFIMSSR